MERKDDVVEVKTINYDIEAIVFGYETGEVPVSER